MFLSSKQSTVSGYPGIGTLVHFPRTMFHFLTKTPAFVITQSGKIQADHWILIGNTRQQLRFAGSLGRKMYNFLKQHYQQIMPEPLLSHPSVCSFYTINAAVHLFKFRQKNNGVQYLKVRSLTRNYM